MTDLRGDLQKKGFRERLEKERLAEEQSKEFHANPLPSQEPFIPSRSAKPLTEIQKFTSHLDMRMEDRKEYEEEQMQRQKVEEEERLHMETLQKAF